MNGQAIRRGCVLASALFALGSVGTVAAQSGPSDLHQEDAPARHHFFVAVDNDN